jgi:PAS domain S-box-containing protein
MAARKSGTSGTAPRAKDAAGSGPRNSRAAAPAPPARANDRKTARALADEAALAGHMAALQAALDAAPFYAWARDRDGRIIFQNKASHRLWGDQRGRTPAESGAHPDVIKAWQATNRRALRGRTVRSEVQYPVDGRLLWFLNIVTPLRVGRRIAGILGFLIDITEQKKTEQALQQSETTLQALADNAADAIFIKDDARRYTFLNASAARLLGRPVEDLIGKTPEEIFDAEAARVVRETDDAAFAGRLYNEERELVIKGRLHVLHTVQTPIRDSDGRVVAICGIVRDVTRRAIAERALQEREEQLEQRVRERTRALQESEERLQKRSRQLARLAEQLTMAEHRERRRLAERLHERLQQQLVGARIQGEVLLKEQDKAARPRLESLLRSLEAAVEESRGVTRELAAPILAHESLADTVRWTVENMQQRYELDVSLRILNSPERLPEPAAVLLHSAVCELLLNVVKHAATPRARLRLHRTRKGVVLTVEDEGEGFSDADTAHTRDDAPGFGLFSIRERAELLGGAFTIDSVPGKGTRAVLTLPVAGAPPGTSGRKDPAARHRSSRT